MPQGRLASPAGTLMGNRPSGRPRTRWRDYISDLAWSSLRVEPRDLAEIAVARELFRILLRLLPINTLQKRKNGHEIE